jgi:hypothetical protein
LRLSGHLLIGVVRIFSRQVGYLHSDATEAVAKIRKAFKRHGAVQGDVDLPEGQTLAKEAAITLRPADDSEFSLHDVDVEFGEFLDVEAVLGSQSLNVAQARDITMRVSQGSEAAELALSQQHGAFEENLPGAGEDWEVELGRAGELDYQAPIFFEDADVRVAGSENAPAPRQLSAAFEQDRDFFEEAPAGGLLDESMAAGRLSVIGAEDGEGGALEGAEQVQKKPRRAAPKRRAAPRKRKAAMNDEHTTIAASEYERRLVGGAQIADTFREVELVDPIDEQLEQQQEHRHRRLDLAGDLQDLLQAPFELRELDDSRMEEEDSGVVFLPSQPEVTRICLENKEKKKAKSFFLCKGGSKSDSSSAWGRGRRECGISTCAVRAV